MDVYCTSSKKRTVKLVDFNSFGPCTDSLLFDWEELLNIGEGGLENTLDFRIVASEIAAQGNQPAYTHNRLPKEAFDFSRDGSSIAEFVAKFSESLIDSV